MTDFWIVLSIILLGFASAAVLFFRFPRLPKAKPEAERFPLLSVIIPARNEEKNLPLLLSDLGAQTLAPLEIICVDDASTDSTAQIALDFDIKLISLREKPAGWTGKTWACQNGTNQAKGELLLFLDADVRLQKDGLARILQAYENSRCTVSVQPYHRTVKYYEQFSLPFNLIQLAGNGTALPKPKNVGLFGPVILMPKPDYIAVGGHERARKSVVEDMTLGQNLKKSGLSYRVFVGDIDVAFRMYGGGFGDLLQGWVKNIATGAVKTPLFVFAMVFFWIASMCSVPLQIFKYAAAGDLFFTGLFALLYLLWVTVLTLLSRRVGRFRFAAVLLYPILLAVMLAVFAVSAFNKLFGLNVRWKGRAVPTREKSEDPDEKEENCACR
ncbi:MAG TPA: glycosyltransferase family 2 protein [Oscillospiraceae bacterium]|nr:glycosyltransferase family 2 protein [Oscillospiraceae bacterium]HPF56245.1 glycosyltransferase family 2 protein [Clostridiales bacterium]HPK35961.1 glycosyltransferase family 2 protein [Oscillospiraceae bacterium]HPR76665.1 glycosyltransferase family 2 protein [Oscillospiraceae bacterium]